MKLAANLFADPDEQEAFADSVLKTHPYRPALVWMRARPAADPFKLDEAQSWQPDFVDRLRRDQRPGQDERHEAGDYYLMNLASVFEAAVFTEIPERPELVVDLCAAPGGKSILAWRMLGPGRLVSNEVIGKRTAPLIANFKRCQIDPAIVTSLDSAALAATCSDAADLVIVDAPCSGQSLIGKGKQVSACFHSHVINHNRNRQRRILSNAAAIVRPGGHVAYMTCTYAEKENEGNVNWFLKNFADFEAVPVGRLKGNESHLTHLPCYRLWPHRGLGPGGFTVLLRRQGDGVANVESIDGLPTRWSSCH